MKRVMSALVTVSGGDGFDVLEVDDSGDADGNIGTLTDHSITGLGMGEGILYSTVEQIDVALGQGDDIFNIQSTAAGSRSVIHGNDGNDTLYMKIGFNK